jgi:anti-sigma B factor antagonist
MNDPARTGALPDPTPSPEDHLQVAVEPSRSGAVVVHVSGDLDLYTAGLLHERLWPQLEHTAVVVIDLTDVAFLGSAGLAELVAAHDVATRNGVRIRLIASGHAVLRPLEVTGLRSAFAVFETLEAALPEV